MDQFFFSGNGCDTQYSSIYSQYNVLAAQTVSSDFWYYIKAHMGKDAGDNSLDIEVNICFIHMAHKYYTTYLLLYLYRYIITKTDSYYMRRYMTPPEAG